ncbi:hypothetical protein BsWGS_13395 [Bradybaena similaris]
MTGTVIDPEDLVRKELTIRFDQAFRNLTEQHKHKLKVIQQEHNFLFSQGYDIPSPEVMVSEMWLKAVTLKTLEERLMYYQTIDTVKHQQTSVVAAEEEVVPSKGVCDGSNSIFYDCVNPDLATRWGNHRLSSAMQFGTPLVIDMDYVDMNSPSDLVPLTQQLWDMYCVNRADPMPFHLIFTNCSKSNPIYRHLALHHMIKTPFILATFTEESHKHLFPVQDLVYLSAQASACMGEFNPNMTYIVGAYYDPLVRKKGSFIRAGEQKIKCLRLPLSENVRWRHQASKDLDLHCLLSLLLAVKAKMSWKDALTTHLPTLINTAS